MRGRFVRRREVFGKSARVTKRTGEGIRLRDAAAQVRSSSVRAESRELDFERAFIRVVALDDQRRNAGSFAGRFERHFECGASVGSKTRFANGADNEILGMGASQFDSITPASISFLRA